MCPCFHRMRSADDESTVEPMDLKHVHLGNWKSFVREKKEYVHFYVELSREGVQRCESELWPTPKLHIRSDGTGLLDEHIPDGGIPFFTKFFIGLGTEATVKKPTELIDSMKRTLSGILNKY